MGQTLEIESLETLINAVNKYQDDLQTNYQILANAANVCDAAMGSDAIAQKHIANLNNALLQLSKTFPKYRTIQTHVNTSSTGKDTEK